MLCVQWLYVYDFAKTWISIAKCFLQDIKYFNFKITFGGLA
jgi:hypothetical protein